MKALRTSVMSPYEVSEIEPGKSLVAAGTLFAVAHPIAVSEETAKTLTQWDRIAARIVLLMGCDWHHLLELCGLVDALVIDQDGVYNPCSPNDRLLLGMKGTIRDITAKRPNLPRRIGLQPEVITAAPVIATVFDVIFLLTPTDS